MNNILLYKCSQEISALFDKAAKKFCGIFSVKLNIQHAVNVHSALRYFEQGTKISLILVQKDLSVEEKNSFKQLIADLKGQKTILALNPEIIDFFKTVHPPNRIVAVSPEMSIQHIYTLLRISIFTKKTSLDIRVIKEILAAIVNIISGNVGTSVKPLPISSSLNPSKESEVTGVFTFFGDGIQISISLAVEARIMKKFASLILGGIAEEDINEEIMGGVIYEFGNQILGSAKGALSSFEYNLCSGFHLIVFGQKHFYRQSSEGMYYNMPFQVDDLKFNLDFCYKLYNTSGNFNRESLETSKVIFDVRLLLALKKSALEVFPALTSKRINFVLVEELDVAKVRKEQCVQISTMHSTVGHFMIGLFHSSEVARAIIDDMLGKDAEMDEDLMGQTVAEISNLLQASFLENARGIGYNMWLHAQVGCASKDALAFQVSGVAKYIRLKFKLDAIDISVVLGVFSEHASPIFDVWECMQSSDKLQDLKKI